MANSRSTICSARRREVLELEVGVERAAGSRPSRRARSWHRRRGRWGAWATTLRLHGREPRVGLRSARRTSSIATVQWQSGPPRGTPGGRCTGRTWARGFVATRGGVEGRVLDVVAHAPHHVFAHREHVGERTAGAEPELAVVAIVELVADVHELVGEADIELEALEDGGRRRRLRNSAGAASAGCRSGWPSSTRRWRAGGPRPCCGAGGSPARDPVLQVGGEHELAAGWSRDSPRDPSSEMHMCASVLSMPVRLPAGADDSSVHRGRDWISRCRP